MSEKYSKHYSVLYNECIGAFKEIANTKEQCHFADMTFGAGGHSLGIAREIASATVYSVDQDQDAIDNGNKRIASEGFNERAFLNKMNFEAFPSWVKENKPELKFEP